MIRKKVVVNIEIYYVKVGHAPTNDVTTNEWYNEQFLSISSGCYNEGGRKPSADVARACT